jgi:signal transduction histidine kinase
MTDIALSKKTLVTIAHDIKAPLSAIISLLSVIDKGYVEDPEKKKEFIARARQKAEVLARMIDDILDFSLLADKSLIKKKPVNMIKVLCDSYHTMKPYANRMSITFDYSEGCTDAKYINGNYTFLLRVFNNLIMNAIKYNKEKGTILFETLFDSERNEIIGIVSDTGIGIPKSAIDKVFQIFERGEQSRKNIDGSLGLGLALVKQIVEDHDGKIVLTSTEGVGTKVKVILPLLIEGEKNESQDFSS